MNAQGVLGLQNALLHLLPCKGPCECEQLLHACLGLVFFGFSFCIYKKTLNSDTALLNHLFFRREEAVVLMMALLSLLLLLLRRNPEVQLRL